MWSQLPLWKRIAIIAGAVLFAYFIWPTPYFYEHCAGGTIVRINRVTGRAKVVYSPPVLLEIPPARRLSPY